MLSNAFLSVCIVGNCLLGMTQSLLHYSSTKKRPRDVMLIPGRHAKRALRQSTDRGSSSLKAMHELSCETTQQNADGRTRALYVPKCLDHFGIFQFTSC
jgi:hypothetical protein